MGFIYNLLLVATLLLTCYGGFNTVSEVYASKDDGCEYGQECSTPKPTCNPTSSPSSTPTLIPSPSLSPVPTATSTPGSTITPTSSSTPIPTPTGYTVSQGGPSGGGSGGSLGGGSSQCEANDPGSVTLISVSPKGSGRVEVKWTKNLNATNYAISYGLGSKNYLYGLASTGNTDSTIISALDPNARYCFAVTPINDCRPGSISNEICVGSGDQGGLILGTDIGGGEVLGLSSTSSQDEKENALVDTSLPNVQIKFDSTNFINPVQVLNNPSNITIPALGIDLPIAEAKVENGLWQNFDLSASHGIGSANPGEGSNVVIFAHAKWNLFGNLKFAQIGNEINVSTKNGNYKYHITQIKVVKPGQIEVLAPSQEETLTLYTCSGLNDEERLVIVAKQ